MPVEYKNNIAKVKVALNDAVIAWLYETAETIADYAASICKFKGEKDDRLGGDLSQSYEAKVDEGKGTARVGSDLESVYWEEYGTGEFAATDKNGGKEGRKGWWIYIEGGSGYDTPTKSYSSKREAEDMAERISKTHHVKAVATNGIKPNFTVEKAFTKIMPKAIKQIQEKLKGLE